MYLLLKILPQHSLVLQDHTSHVKYDVKAIPHISQKDFGLNVSALHEQVESRWITLLLDSVKIFG